MIERRTWTFRPRMGRGCPHGCTGPTAPPDPRRRSRWRMDTRNTSPRPRLLRARVRGKRVSSSFCTTIGISVRAGARSGATSIRGSRSRTGVAPSRFWRRDRKSTRPGSVCGERATPADTQSSSARPTTRYGPSSPRSRPSAASSKAFDASHRCRRGPGTRLRRRRARTLPREPPRRQAIVSDDPAVPASYRAPDAVGFYLSSPCRPELGRTR